MSPAASPRRQTHGAASRFDALRFESTRVVRTPQGRDRAKRDSAVRLFAATLTMFRIVATGNRKNGSRAPSRPWRRRAGRIGGKREVATELLNVMQDLTDSRALRNAIMKRTDTV
jgi:hypothetical protein